MKKPFMKRAISILLIMLMVLELVPMTGAHAHETKGDHTDLSIDFDYQSMYGSAQEALMAEAKKPENFEYYSVTKDQVFQEGTASHWHRVYDGDLKREGGKFRELMESSDPKEKYIVLTQDVELRYNSGEWKPIRVTSDKVLDLNGFTMTWWDMTNKEKGENWQSENIYDHYLDKYFIYIQEGATLTIIDSSAPVNGYDTGKGTGAMVTGAQIIDAYSNQLDYYTHRDLFVVDGNLVIYGGTFTAGRQKDQYKKNFTWDKLADCLGKTLDLGLSIAEYATGLDAAAAAFKDVKAEFANAAPANGNTSDSGETGTSDSATSKPTGDGGKENKKVDTPESAGPGNDSKARPQTVGERTDSDKADNSTSNNQSGGSAAQTGGKNESNAKGTAKNDKNSKIAAAEKNVVTAALNKNKITDMFSKGMDVIKAIGSMLGKAEGTRVTQTIHGTVAKVNTSGTLVVYGGTFQGHGATPHVRNATIEVVRLGLHSGSDEKLKNDGGRAYIFGGTFEGYAGANIFNFVRAPKGTLTGVAQAFDYSATNHEIEDIRYLYQTEHLTVTINGKEVEYTIEYPYIIELDASETNNMEVLHYENQDEIKGDPRHDPDPIPIDTSNVVVRGGTFRTYCELANEGIRLPYMKEEDPTGMFMTFVKFTGTSGSVNLGVESFGEDMIRDGRIQLVDVYGDGTLVLMDEKVDAAHPAGLKHYRLYCGDTELRHIRYLDVYPMNAGSNSTHSFALQTYYGNTNLSNISTWNTENDEENLHTAPFAGDEYFFDYEFDGRDARDYYVMPNLDGEMYDTGMQDSEAWYYPEPVDSKGNPIPDFRNTVVLANFTYKGQPRTAEVQSLHGLSIFDPGDYEEFGSATYTRHVDEAYRDNLKWFRYRVYRVDPITRENISESDYFGTDRPLAEVVYGVAENEAMRCKLDLYDLSQYLIEKTKDTDNPWTGYKPGELYRIVFNVDEYVNFGYTGPSGVSDKALSFNWESQLGDDWSVRKTYLRRGESYAGVMPVASTESSVLFRCSSVSEQAELPNTNASSNVFFDTDYTPLQFDTFAVMAGKKATVNFVNAKVSQADNAGNDFIDVYYQWYISDDPIVDRDPRDPNKVTDELLAGMTNVCLDWNSKSDHKPEKWNPAADIYDYRNSLSPDDPHYEEYGEDGLPNNKEYWTMYDLHAYTTELRQNELCMKPGTSGNLTMQNNNPFAFNTDSCYIPEEAAGKYLYVKAVVVNAKEEYTKIYDKKQVFYSHPMLIIDSSMMIPETQQPDMESIQQTGDTYHYASIYATVGEDLLFGFSATALPEDLKREGFEVRISQKVYDPYNAEEVIYEANNGDLINLKDYITEPGRYTVEQTQELYYKRPYWSWEINQFREALIKEEYVATRIDSYRVTIDLPSADRVWLDYPTTGFGVGDEITITATVEPEGDWWYKWMLDDASAINDMTVLQDSQSPVLKYAFKDETPQRIWVAVYAKDKYGNSSVDPKYSFTEEIFPCESIYPKVRYDGTVITEDRELRYIRVNEDPVNLTVDVEGGSGNYVITGYKRSPKTDYYNTNLGNGTTITIDTSKTGTTDYWFRVNDADAHAIVDSNRVRVVVTDWLDVTPFRTGTTTINKPTTLNMGASKVVGHDVTFTLERQSRSLWVPVSDAVFDSDGKCMYTVQNKGSNLFRLTATDYYGDTKTFMFVVNYDDSVPQPVAADGSGKLMFRVKGTDEYKTVFREGEDIEAFFTGGIDYDPGSPLYEEIRAKIKEELGLEIDPVADKVEINFTLLRYNDPNSARIGASGGVNVYEEAGLDVWQGSLQDFTFDTPSKMPEAPVSHIDGTHMTPGYYYASWWVFVDCNDDYFVGGGAGSWEDFTMSGAFEVVADGAEHVHDFSYNAGTIDQKNHYVECICGYREEGEHDFSTQSADHNRLDIPWNALDLPIITDEGEMIYRYSGVEMRMCNTNWCWHTQYRWAYVEDLSLATETLEMDVNESTKMNHTVDFMEELDAQWQGYWSTYFSEEDIANFLPGNTAVTWTSSDESVVTVDADGNITAVGSGTATITATTVQYKYAGPKAGRISASCTVTVSCDHPDIVPVAAKESTCQVVGFVSHYKCNVCGTVSLDGTCTDGKTLEDVSLPLATHAVSNVFGYNEEGHFRTCKYGCGYQFGAVTAHSYNVAEADCTTSKYCTRCKYVAEEAKSHDLIYMDAMEATCTDAGLNACYNCMNCGRYFLDAEGSVETTESKLNIRPLGHSWTDATCTDPKTCTRCGETEGAELGHNWSTATCESPETCGRCGETSGAALGHTWVAATCAAPKTCSTCHKTEGDKPDHTFVDGYCSVCGADDPNVIIYTVTLMFGDSPVGWLSAEPGQPVVKPEDPAQEGMVFLGWFTEEDVLFDFNTPITEDIALYAKFESAGTLDPNIKIYHTLDLASDISITFAVPKSLLTSYDSYYLECVLPEYTGNTQTGTSTMIVQPVDKGSYYYFTLTGITAVRMGDMVNAVLHMTKGEAKFYSATDQFSVATYAYNMLNSSKDAKMLTLCADLLRYGAEAQSFKKYRTDALVDAEMTETHRSYLSNTESLTFTSTDAFLGDLASPVITWVGKTLDLGSKVGMKFVFNTKNYTGDLANLCMRVTYKGSNGDTKTVMLTDIEVYSAKNNYYAFTFYGLLASELRTVVDVAVFEKTTQVSESLRYSAETYAAKNTAGVLAPLCKALFAYSDSAKAYFAK